VVVTEEGFEFEGKLHRSLTSIAREITGAAWSGPRFFGLARAASASGRNDAPLGKSDWDGGRVEDPSQCVEASDACRPRQEGSSSIEPKAEAKRAARGSLRKSTREAPSNLAGGLKIRCAIYTRKSSEEGLEQEFNSLDAQRGACEAFVRSQKHEGWSVLPQLYDDPGYSGGPRQSMNVPKTISGPGKSRRFAWTSWWG
jgi:Protein of unknown function (DUF2924)